MAWSSPWATDSRYSQEQAKATVHQRSLAFIRKFDAPARHKPIDLYLSLCRAGAGGEFFGAAGELISVRIRTLGCIILALLGRRAFYASPVFFMRSADKNLSSFVGGSVDGQQRPTGLKMVGGIIPQILGGRLSGCGVDRGKYLDSKACFRCCVASANCRKASLSGCRGR